MMGSLEPVVIETETRDRTLDNDKHKELLMRERVEDFMYREAHLLDEWRLDEWFALTTEDIKYQVPATDAREDYSDALVIISDDAARLRQRVEQLLGGATWCENPRSRTHRMISNVCIQSEKDGELEVIANFIIHRFGNGRSDTFVGKYKYILVVTANSFKIRRRTVLLDHESLVEQGKISIIL